MTHTKRDDVAVAQEQPRFKRPPSEAFHIIVPLNKTGLRMMSRLRTNNQVDEESVDHFQWEKPEEFARAEALLLGWASVINGSEFLRTHAGR